MIAHHAATPTRPEIEGRPPSAAVLGRDREPDAMMVDGMGRILGCGAGAEHLFGANRGRLLGRQISDFVGHLFLEGTSPSYNTRHLAHLCADGEWRKFAARDVRGHPFAVEISLSRRTTEGQEVFVLNLRRLDEMPGVIGSQPGRSG